MAPQDNAYAKYLRSNSNLSNLADAYKAIRDFGAEQGTKGLKAQPPSDEEKYARARLEATYQGPTANADVAPPPTTPMPQPATDIEGGYRVSRPADAPFRTSTAVRRAKSAIGTLENQQPGANDIGGSPGASGGGIGGSSGGKIPPNQGGGIGGSGSTLEDHIANTLENARQNGTLATAESIAESSASATKGLRLPPKSAAIGTGIIGITDAVLAIAQGEPPLETLAKAGGDLLVLGGTEAVLTAAGVPQFISLPLATIASREADKLIGKLFGDDKAQLKQQPSQVIQAPVFQGGQCAGVMYTLSITCIGYGGRTDAYPPLNLYGPIQLEFVPYQSSDPNSQDGFSINVISHTAPDGSYSSSSINSHWVTYARSYSNLQVVRVDGGPDNCGNPPPMPPTPGQTQTTNNITNVYQAPLAADLGKQDKPRLTPLGDRPLEQAKRKPQTVAIAPSSPFSITPPGWTIPGFPNGGTVTQNPNGSTMIAPADGGQGYTLESPGKGPVTISIPGMQPITLNPDGTSDGTNPNIFNPTQLTPTPLKSTPLTSNPLVPTPLTPNQPTTTPTTPDATYQEILKQLQQIGIGVGTLGVVGKGITDKLAQNNNTVQQIAQQTTPDNLSSAAATGTCKTLQPGGCMSKLANNAEQAAQNSAANKNLLSNLGNNLANLAELDLLAPMNGKLDGINDLVKAFRKRFDDFVEWSKPGRILQLFTFLTALHNAFMLSQGVKVTLIQVIEDWMKVAAPFFGKDLDKNPINLNEIINGEIHDFFVGVIGDEETVKKYEELFKSLNRIYQSATNLLNNIQMLFFSVTMSLQVIAEHTGKIGNALKKYGVVGHNAYPWMNPAPNLKNKWIGAVDAVTHKINGLINGLFAIDMIAQGILQSRQAVDQMAEEKQKIHDEMYAAYKDTKEIIGLPEFKPEADTALLATTNSKGQAPTLQDIADMTSGILNNQ